LFIPNYQISWDKEQTMIPDLFEISYLDVEAAGRTYEDSEVHMEGSKLLFSSKLQFAVTQERTIYFRNM
jgi:hypothetical protein